MSILIDKTTRVIVQGITGRDGEFHTRKMIAYGTQVVGGVSPGKGGTNVQGVPVFNTVYKAVQQTKANTSIIFVPARFAADCIMEAADAGISLIICITEGIPTQDVIKAYHYAKLKGARLIGPNCPGLITPEESLVGILPGSIFRPGNIGVISRSGTLTYEIVYHLTAAGFGQSTAVGMGGDPVVGLYYIDLLDKNGLKGEDIAWLVPHQANLRIIDAVVNRTGVDYDKVVINIDHFGNTSAASIPLGMWEAQNKFKKGDNIILTAFGAGFNWGALWLKWGY
jgi:succinyl-CoA synthetase alpha subunit